MNTELYTYIRPWREYDKIEWLEDLIWCPSQISMRFVYHGQRFELYLRWRSKDPWSATLISFPPDSEDSVWIDIIDFPTYKDQEYKEAESWCENWLLKQIQTKEFNKYLIEHGEIF